VYPLSNSITSLIKRDVNDEEIREPNNEEADVMPLK
jgi:hypothetical protein